MKLKTVMLIVTFSMFGTITMSQNIYKYALDLNSKNDNSISVSLVSPRVSSIKVLFCFPKIIPGTYMISDFGKFIKNVKAFDDKGKQLKVNKKNIDQWEISSANTLRKITYDVEGIFDTKEKHPVYPMAATSIENDDVVINSPGFFGYFENQTDLPVEVTINKPSDYYASTSMVPAYSSKTKDVFSVSTFQNLYDEPILYSVPDTATVQVGNCSVLFSVYSPGKQIHATEIASLIQNYMEAVKKYLGGTLPANKYAFLYYFHKSGENKSFTPGIGGALEHVTSSFYYLPEFKIGSGAKNFLIDASLHEFFHIITPLTISSKEIKQFNFDSANLSKHLWLYEGSTEYNAQYVQARYGLITIDDFFSRLSDKITQSQSRFNDTLPFTELSKHSADIYNDQYENVYQKGAMISACLDIYLLHLSGGKYGLRDLTHDLGQKFGINKSFDDNELFDIIGKITYPEIKDFLNKYVAGSTPIDYKYFFDLAGIEYIPKIEKQALTFGKVSFGQDSTGQAFIRDMSKANEFGKAMGYKTGDIIYSYNGLSVSNGQLGTVIDTVKKQMRAGDILEAKVGRKNEKGIIDTVTLKAKIYTVPVTDFNVLKFLPNPGSKQITVQKAWLTPETDKTYGIK